MAASSTAPNLDKAYNECAWPRLSLEEAMHILSHWASPTMGASSPARAKQVIWHSKHPFSSAGIIQLTDGGKLFLKRHSNTLRTTETLSEEHRFAAYLNSKGFPACAPLTMRDGGTALAWGEYVYEVFPLFTEHDSYRETNSWQPYHNTQHAYSSGQLLGRLHRASEGYHAPPRNNPPLISSIQPLLTPTLSSTLPQWAAQQEGLASLLPSNGVKEALTILEPFHQKLVPLLPHIQPLWGHGDWHGSNLLWHASSHTPNELIASRVFDFGMCDQSCAPFDLAVAIERSFINWLSPTGNITVYHDQLAAFLQGYENQRPRSPEEVALTSALLPLCHVTFALSEIAYYGHILQYQGGADISYHHYLIGHATWFQHTQGQILLEILTRA